jgi:hypothetical protein
MIFERVPRKDEDGLPSHPVTSVYAMTIQFDITIFAYFAGSIRYKQVPSFYGLTGPGG